MDFVWPSYPRERIEYELQRIKDAIEHALAFEVLFGKKGIEIFHSLAPHQVPAIIPQLEAVVPVIDNIITQFREQTEFLSMFTPELHSVTHAFNLLSVACTMYHELRSKFLLTEHAAVWIVLSKASGLPVTVPRFPFNWEYENTAIP
ncbi:MAG: hypothetical protein JNM66_07770 [Bryobacterales bacterium]|nr:hypothetical protein [Bryobacterales bacterium]